jgi:hypothetical protein
MHLLLTPARLHMGALVAWAPQPVMLAFQFSHKKDDVYNILWVLVFGFATLNILGLVARRFEPSRARMSFGETIAVMVVFISVVLLGWEMATIFKIFPLRLHHH